MNPSTDDPKFKTSAAANYVGCSPRTLEKFRQIGADRSSVGTVRMDVR